MLSGDATAVAARGLHPRLTIGWLVGVGGAPPAEQVVAQLEAKYEKTVAALREDHAAVVKVRNLSAEWPRFSACVLPLYRAVSSGLLARLRAVVDGAGCQPHRPAGGHQACKGC